MFADPGFVRYMGGHPLCEEDAWLGFLRMPGHWALFDFGTWAIEERKTRRYIGHVGFTDRRRDLDPPLAGTPEIAWAIAPSFQRQGYGTEAVRAALDWADRSLPFPATACVVHPDNVVSLRLAAKSGYVYAGRPTYRDEPVVLLMRVVHRARTEGR